MKLLKTFAIIISLIPIIFIGICLVLSYGFYSPQEITQHKALSKITNVDFPKVRMFDWILVKAELTIAITGYTHRLKIYRMKSSIHPSRI